MHQHAATFFAQAEAAAGADLPQFVNDEFDAFIEYGILAHGFLRLRCGDCGHVLAPNTKLRARVVPQGRVEGARATPPAECEPNRAHHRPARMSWAWLLERVYGFTGRSR